MKKKGTINVQLSRLIAQMGHTDRLVICDSGFPIPRGAEVVDLALTRNIPRFIDTVKVVLEELEVESVVVAKEMEGMNKECHKALMRELGSVGVSTIKKTTHEDFKRMTLNGGTIAFLRTGEATPFANVILVSGVTFD